MFEENTYKAVLARMLDRVPETLDKREGSVIFDAHAPAAMEFARLYIELERVLAETFGGTASREYLILRCAERGIVPKAATCARLRAQAVPDGVDITGMRFNLGELNYTAERRLSDGGFEMRCEAAGVQGNQALGRLTPIDYVPGLERAELTGVLIPGADEEDTEALRARYLASFAETSFGGNRRDYIEKTNAVAGVGGCKVDAVWNGGIRPAALVPGEAVRTWYEGARTALSGEVQAWLDAVYTAAADGRLTVGGTVRVTVLDARFLPPDAALVEAVQQALDPAEYTGEGAGLSPIGHVVTVRGAVGTAVYVDTHLTFAAGYDWENVQSAAEKTVEAYLQELRTAWAQSEALIVRVSQIETRLLAVPGVLDVEGTALNGETQNLVLGAYEAPVMGAVRQNARGRRPLDPRHL